MRKLVLLSLALALSGIACQEGTRSPDAGSLPLKEGDEAPGFTLQSPETEVSLGDYRGKKSVLLYFSMGPG